MNREIFIRCCYFSPSLHFTQCTFHPATYHPVQTSPSYISPSAHFTQFYFSPSPFFTQFIFHPVHISLNFHPVSKIRQYIHKNNHKFTNYINYITLIIIIMGKLSYSYNHRQERYQISPIPPAPYSS